MQTEQRPRFHRFSELTGERLSAEYQIHTNWTDGAGTVREVLEAARAADLKEIAFTEHARHNSTYYPEFFQEIERERQAFADLTVYRGFEVKVVDFDGTLDISDEMRAAADIVLASVHSFPGRDGGGVIRPRDVPRAQAHRIERDLSLGVIARASADVLSHPGGMSMRFHGGFPMEYFDDLLAAIRGTDMAFELNHSYHAPIFDDLVALIRAHDPLVSIGSDVHALTSMGACRDALKRVLEP